MLKGVIILEGADASGKTTLANKLIELNNGNGQILHAIYRFKDKMPLYHMALLRKAIKLGKNQLVIIDRLHISEFIYAKVFRNGTNWPEAFNNFEEFCKYLRIPIILCVPETIQRGLIWFKKAKQERFEMYDDIKEVITEYCNYANIHKYDKNIIIYNRDFAEMYKDEYETYIISILKRFLNEVV